LTFAEGLRHALPLLVTLDPELLRIVAVSLQASLLAVTGAAIIGVPIGAFLGVVNFRGRDAIVAVVHTLMAVPTVAIGLICYMLLSREGPLGPLGLLYSPAGIALGQGLLALPLIVALTRGAVASVDPRCRQTAWTLGARPVRLALVMVREAGPTQTAALLAAFGRVLSEVGIALVVGGNIRGRTRTLTTAIALEVQRGDFGLALALAMILVAAALAVVVVGEILKRRRW